MKLQLHQLSAHLKNNLLPIYVIAGEELLLVQETNDAIRHAAFQAGYHERQRFEVTKEFDWNSFLEAANNLSLFSHQCVIELRFTHKPNAAGSKILMTYLERLPKDKLLVILIDKLDQATQKTNWFQKIAEMGVIIPIWAMDQNQFLKWIQQRLTQAGLTADQDSIRYLAGYTEGNLLAASQEIIKLQLLYEKGKISSEQIVCAINDHARYTVFSLVDAILQTDCKRALRILKNLRNEGIELPLILWSLTREIRNLISLHHSIASGSNLETAFRQQKVWEKRQSLLKKSLKIHSLKDLHHMLLHASKIDYLIKGVLSGNAWDEIAQLILAFVGIQKGRNNPVFTPLQDHRFS